MTLPAFLFGTMIALLLGAGFHLWRGGGLGKIIGYVFFSEAGFWTGHFAAQFWEIKLWGVGPIRFGTAIVGAILFLFIGRWLIEYKKV